MPLHCDSEHLSEESLSLWRHHRIETMSHSIYLLPRHFLCYWNLPLDKIPIYESSCKSLPFPPCFISSTGTWTNHGLSLWDSLPFLISSSFGLRDSIRRQHLTANGLASVWTDNQSQWPANGIVAFQNLPDCDNFCHHSSTWSKNPFLSKLSLLFALKKSVFALVFYSCIHVLIPMLPVVCFILCTICMPGVWEDHQIFWTWSYRRL